MSVPRAIRRAGTRSTRRILVVGGGAAGVLTTAALARRAHPSKPVEIRVIEREDLFGPGLAYGKADPDHLVNNTANRMSAVQDDPDPPAALVRGDAASGRTAAAISRDRPTGATSRAYSAASANRPGRR